MILGAWRREGGRRKERWEPATARTLQALVSVVLIHKDIVCNNSQNRRILHGW